MLFQNFAIVSVLAALGAAQAEIDMDNVPQQCRTQCQQVQQITQNCDNSTDDDSDQRQCVCSAQNARSIITDCANCVRQNDNDSDSDSDDTDIFEVASNCNFPVAAATTSAGANQQVSSVIVVTSSTPVVVVPTSSLVRTSVTVPVSSGTGVASQTTNAAPAATAGAAMGIGALGLALGML